MDAHSAYAKMANDRSEVHLATAERAKQNFCHFFSFYNLFYIQESNFAIQDSIFYIHESSFAIQDLIFYIQESRFPIQDLIFYIQESSSPIQDFIFCIQESSYTIQKSCFLCRVFISNNLKQKKLPIRTAFLLLIYKN